MADPVEGSTPTPPTAKAGAVTAPKPPAAPKPAAKPKESADPPDPLRRRVIWGMIYGYLGINLLMFLRFFFPRALYEPNTIFNIGYPADFSIGIDQRFLMTNRAWVFRGPDRSFVFSRAARTSAALRNGSPRKTNSSVLATAAVMTARASTLKGLRRGPWTGPRSLWTRPEKSWWIRASCSWMTRAPESINSTIQARICRCSRTGFSLSGFCISPRQTDRLKPVLLGA